MSSLRLVTWNCRSGGVHQRCSELAEWAPDLVFLQECAPGGAALPLYGQVISRRVNARKGVALACLNSDFSLRELGPAPAVGDAVIAAAVEGPVSFNLLGVWSQAPRYVDDVLRKLEAYAAVLSSGPAVVMGDLNSGADLTSHGAASKGHQRLLAAMSALGLVSAYHAFHGLTQGEETNATYHHQFKPTQPWHIDFCFVPANWLGSIVDVKVEDGAEWCARSDHRPLVVHFEGLNEA